MIKFNNSEINYAALKKKAYNLRWAEVGEGVIPLTAADVDFPCAPEIVNAIKDYISDGYFSYTPKRGLPQFNEAIANMLLRRKNIEADANLILPIDSAARGMSIIANTYLKEGDEAIVFDPVDYLFATTMAQAGAKIIKFPMKMVDGRIDFSDLESYITPKTKMLGLCNPHNPLGRLYPMEDLEHIAKICKKHEIYIMNDEIWSDIVYSGNSFNSILHLPKELNERTITVSGLSKSYGVAGLRIGYIVCPSEKVFNEIVPVSEVDSTVGGISSLSQIAGIACFNECDYWLDAYISHLEQNRNFAVERLSKIPEVSVLSPDATFVLFVDISKLGMISDEFTAYLKDEHKLAIVPGGEKYFGAGSEGFVRICLATSQEVLSEGLDRFEKAIVQLRKG